jgi:hypothetical protein
LHNLSLNCALLFYLFTNSRLWHEPPHSLNEQPRSTGQSYPVSGMLKDHLRLAGGASGGAR